jgi:hypothetical protein
MVLRTDRPLLVRVSFDATRLSPLHPIAAYARLVPSVRRTSLRTSLADVPASKVKTASTGMRGER